MLPDHNNNSYMPEINFGSEVLSKLEYLHFFEFSHILYSIFCISFLVKLVIFSKWIVLQVCQFPRLPDVMQSCFIVIIPLEYVMTFIVQYSPIPGAYFITGWRIRIRKEPVILRDPGPSLKKGIKQKNKKVQGF